MFSKINEFLSRKIMAWDPPAYIVYHQGGRGQTIYNLKIQGRLGHITVLHTVFKGQVAWEFQIMALIIQWWHGPKAELPHFKRGKGIGRLRFFRDSAWLHIANKVRP